MEKIERLLLVDDDTIANHLHTLLFEDLDLAKKMEVVENGEEALSFLREFYSNNIASAESKLTIFLDLNMPVMDGFQFLEEFQHESLFQNKKIEIFILTSSLNARDIEKAEKFGIRGYIPKPLTEEKIYQFLA